MCTYIFIYSRRIFNFTAFSDYERIVCRKMQIKLFVENVCWLLFTGINGRLKTQMNEVNRKIKMSEKHVCLVLNIHTYSIDWSLETCLMWHFSCSSGVERENKTNFEIFPTGKMCWAHWIPDVFRNRRLIIFRFFFFCLIVFRWCIWTDVLEYKNTLETWTIRSAENVVLFVWKWFFSLLTHRDIMECE